MSHAGGPAAWRDAAAAAVTAVDSRLGPRGQWPGWVYADADPAASGRRDIAAPVTALGMLAFAGLPLPGVPEVLARSGRHLELTVRPGGLWRYYANIPPDTDDSAMCALALGPDHPVVAGRTADSLTATRLADGPFPTWFAPGFAPVVDPVANAHVVAVVGPGPATEAAVAWLGEVIAAGREVAESAYYLDPLDLHVALTRAVGAGVTGLRPALATAAQRAHDRLLTSDLSAHRTAQAVVVAANGHPTEATALAQAADRLLNLRAAPGWWAADTLFVAANTEAPGRWRYQSEAVTSALCARALLVAAQSVAAR